METNLVPWWGWLILIVLIAAWIFMIGFMMEAVGWIAEKVIGSPLRPHNSTGEREREKKEGAARVRVIDEAKHGR